MESTHSTEQNILGAILTLGRPALAGSIQQGLKADDFTDWRHRIILLAAKDITGDRIDLVTVSDALFTAGLLEAAGGLEYLHDLASNTFRKEE